MSIYNILVLFLSNIKIRKPAYIIFLEKYIQSHIIQ
jgi:hypothetical protein